MAAEDDGGLGVLAWQWALYPSGHTTRTNLLIHILTVPVFQLGTITLLGFLWIASPYAIVGAAMMALAMAAQGRGHAIEPKAPVPFRGPGDVVARIMAEQWIAFPRFVLTGGFARAWNASTPQPRPWSPSEG
jgi:hypothetical protein